MCTKNECKNQKSCETCPYFEECYDIESDVEDDYETLDPIDFLRTQL